MQISLRFPQFATLVGVAAAASLFALPLVASAATPAPLPAVCDNQSTATPFDTVTEPITEPDSANSGGNWANDTFTETATLWLGTDGTTICADGKTSGTFVTTGPVTPNDGTVALAAGITGTFSGEENWIFPTGTAATTTSDSTDNLSADNSSTTGQFNNWQSQILTGSGVPAGANGYAFTYVTDASSTDTWTNADSGNTGNITDPSVSTVYVNGTTGNDSNMGSQSAPFKTIQAGVNAVTAGGTVNVAADKYTEQVTINKDLTLDGAGATTEIDSPATLAAAPFTASGSSAKPIVLVNGADNVTIENLEVNGLGLGNSNENFMGIAYYNAGGTISGTTVTNMSETPLNGDQGGNGIWVYNDATTTTVAITGNTVSAYQKNGIVARGTNLTANVTDNTVTGPGVTDQIAGNGIEVAFGANGTITGNTVSGNYCEFSNPGNDDCLADPTTSPDSADSSAAVLLYETGNATTTVSNNTLNGNQVGISTVDVPAVSITGNTVSTPASGTAPTQGIGIFYNEASAVTTSADVTGNTIDGNTYGILAYDNAATPGASGVVANNNTISGNTTGVWANGTSLDATGNWWGSQSGPTVASNSGGTGDSVSTSTISYSPWLCAAGGTQTTTTGTDCTVASSGGSSSGGGGGGGNGPVVGGGGGGGGGTAVVEPFNGGAAPTGGTGTGGTTTTTTGTTGQVLGASAYNFATNFGYGATGEDVIQLQTVLIADGYLDISAPTGWFGPLTEAAVKLYQKANGIPNTGFVGVLTRASLNAGVTPTSAQELQSLETELQSLEAQIAALETTTTQ